MAAHSARASVNTSVTVCIRQRRVAHPVAVSMASLLVLGNAKLTGDVEATAVDHAMSPATATTVSPTTSAVPGTQRALDVLALITVENEQQAGYQRDLFAEGLDVDGDSCATRDEVLIRETLVTPQVDPSGCGVLAGQWLSVYDGVTVTHPAVLEVDHVVALKEAWDSGAWQWDVARRAEFANDLVDARTLRAVTAHSNASKGQADPSNWLPSNEAFVCTYLADWIAIKARWELSMDQSEFGRIGNVLGERCPDQTIAPWPTTQPWTPTSIDRRRRRLQGQRPRRRRRSAFNQRSPSPPAPVIRPTPMCASLRPLPIWTAVT